MLSLPVPMLPVLFNPCFDIRSTRLRDRQKKTRAGCVHRRKCLQQTPQYQRLSDDWYLYYKQGAEAIG